MPGRHINDQQVRLFMTLRIDHTQQTAAAIAGISVASARRLGKHPQTIKATRALRSYRTRSDPLVGIWDEEILPMLQASPGLRPVTIYEELCRRLPDRVDQALRRTIERRIREWRALHGAERSVIFPQAQVPGRMGLSDFTDANDLGVTIGNVTFPHRLYHFAMAYSGFEHAEVVLGGESYVALASGLAAALIALGGVPLEHRSDSLSAAFRNLAVPDAEDITRRYAALVEHYGMIATRNNRGVAHENGAIESRNGHLKFRLGQAIELRGHGNFDTLDEYRGFVASVVGAHNRRHHKMIEIERPLLRPLPLAQPVVWEEATVRVTSTSGFSLRQTFYTVPSKLIGYRLRLRIHDDHIDVFLGGSLLFTLRRGRRPAKNSGRSSTHVVDYHHVIGSLRAKPGALANLSYLDALWPRPAYRQTWEALKSAKSVREASRTMVGLLALAHDQGVEGELALELEAVLSAGGLPDLAALRTSFTPVEASAPVVIVRIPPLSVYDGLLRSTPFEGIAA
ncbi:MAG: family transposase [Sphingomonas bacterium]|nr:family transposase [Sphingomonas bacterium]